MQVQQGLLDYLQNTEALEKARDLDMGKSEGHKECTYPDLPSKATVSPATLFSCILGFA